MDNGTPVMGSLFVYVPNKVAPIFFTLAFAISAFGHIWQCYRYSCFKLIGLQPLCAVLLTAGYALREYAAFNYLYSKQNLISYIMSLVLIYICPPLVELANYHVLGRIFYYIPHLTPLPPGRVLSTFGALMAAVELLNSLGVAFAANPSSTQGQQKLGSQLILAAIGIQLGVIVIFVILAAVFHQRCTKAQIRTRGVPTLLVTLYISMLLISIRCIYRLVEHLGNTTVRLGDFEALKSLSPILRFEWFFYVFEATLMLVNSVLWNVWNPGRFLPKTIHVYLAKDGRTEIEEEQKEDERPLLAKIASALTFGAFFRNNNHTRLIGELDDYPDRHHQT